MISSVGSNPGKGWLNYRNSLLYHRGVLSRESNSEKIDGIFVYILFMSNFCKISMTIDVTIAEKMKAGPFSITFIII